MLSSPIRKIWDSKVSARARTDQDAPTKKERDMTMKESKGHYIYTDRAQVNYFSKAYIYGAQLTSLQQMCCGHVVIVVAVATIVVTDGGLLEADIFGSSPYISRTA